MSTTNIITGWLNDDNGEKFAPKTLSTQVLMSDGNNLENKIKNIGGGNTKITLIKDGVESTLNGMRINQYDTKDDYDEATKIDGEFYSFPDNLEEESFVYRRKLTANDDLDNITEPGLYYYGTDSIPVNCPFSNAGIVEVIRVGSRIKQTVTRYGLAGQTQFRVNNSLEWYGWEGYAIQSNTCKAPVSLNKQVSYTPAAANTYYNVTSVVIPAKSFYDFAASPIWMNSKGTGISIHTGSTSANSNNMVEDTIAASSGVTARVCGYAETKLTFYIWAKWSGASQNRLDVYGFYIPSV